MTRAAVVIALSSLCSTAIADRAAEPASGAPAPRQEMEVVARRRTPPPPTPARPPVEIATLGKQVLGTYTCKGNTQRGDGSSTPLVATVTVKLDLDDAWIQTTMVETGKPGGLKFVEYRTFDATAKQWTRVQLVNNTSHVTSTSLGEKDGKWTWTGDSVSPSGTLQLHDYEQRDAKELKLWGEALLGGTWQKTYEVSSR